MHDGAAKLLLFHAPTEVLENGDRQFRVHVEQAGKPTPLRASLLGFA